MTKLRALIAAGALLLSGAAVETARAPVAAAEHCTGSGHPSGYCEEYAYSVCTTWNGRRQWVRVYSTYYNGVWTGTRKSPTGVAC